MVSTLNHFSPCLTDPNSSSCSTVVLSLSLLSDSNTSLLSKASYDRILEIKPSFRRSVSHVGSRGSDWFLPSDLWGTGCFNLLSTSVATFLIEVMNASSGLIKLQVCSFMRVTGGKGDFKLRDTDMVMVRGRMTGGKSTPGTFNLDRPHIIHTVITIIKYMRRVPLHLLAFTNQLRIIISNFDIACIVMTGLFMHQAKFFILVIDKYSDIYFKSNNII